MKAKEGDRLEKWRLLTKDKTAEIVHLDREGHKGAKHFILRMIIAATENFCMKKDRTYQYLHMGLAFLTTFLFLWQFFDTRSILQN